MRNRRILGILTILGMVLVAFAFPVTVQGSVDATLTSVSVTVGPTLDGTVESLWNEATAITTSTGVQIKSVYTDSDIYFLAIWSDSTLSVEKNMRTLTNGEWNTAGNEDRLGFAWNLDDSTANFNTDGCQAVCHGTTMATNAATETIDVWHWKAARSDHVGYADDKWWNNDVDAADVEAAHHGDAKTSGSYSDNKQDLNNSVEVVTVPKYYEPDATGDDAKFITQAEISNGDAIEITAVDVNGTLTYSGGTVPATAEIPGYILELPVGSRGDVKVASSYSGGEWTLEIKRALDTGNSDDIQFSDTTENSTYYFGVAEFDNEGGASHETTGNNVYILNFGQETTDTGTGDGDGGKILGLDPLIFVIIIVVIIAAVVGVMMMKKGGSSPTPKEEPTKPSEDEG